MNSDFIRTSSYSSKIYEYSKYYKTFSGVLSVRMITAEYLIAMKLCSGRQYKHDLSDIIGVLASHEKQGNPITFQKVDMAVCNLYGSWECIPEHSQKYIHDIMQEGNYNSKYDLIIKEEQQAKNILINFEQEYSQVLNTKNIEKILLDLKAKQSKRDSILEQLKSKKM